MYLCEIILHSRPLTNMEAGSQNSQYGYPNPGPQSPTGQEVMDHVFFCSNEEWERAREVEVFDYIVIGTGPCGLAFVERVLSHEPQARILMLERGGYFLPEHFQNLPFAFANTVGGLSETFPWTLSKETKDGDHIKFIHGMVPFLGGRSLLWSTWCPRPNDEEFFGWPKAVVASAKKYFDSAEKLMNVVEVGPGDKVDGVRHMEGASMHPIYDTLQVDLTNRIHDNLANVKALTRSMAAPLAVGVTQLKGIDFRKFATLGPLLELVEKQKDAKKKFKGTRLKIATYCIVQQIYHKDNKATSLKTSKGFVNIGEAKLILAMGTVPSSTLIVNSFPDVPNVGLHLSAHFVSVIVGRISIADMGYGCGCSKDLKNIELGAVYVAGIHNNHKQQFHVQLSAFHDVNPAANAKYTFQYAPDVIATASKEQLETSEGYIVFVLACVGEMDVNNINNLSKLNPADKDQTTNILVNLTTNKTDEDLWDVMDDSSFELLEKVISPQVNGKHKVEYWHGSPDDGEWLTGRPSRSQIRVPGAVHESSTLIIGEGHEENSNSSVGLDYRPHGVENVYVTGGGLWPRSGSWNPTLTMVALTQHLADIIAGKKI